MTIPEELQKLIDGGESITVEFKESHTDITKDVYDTVCSFSNRDGGHIFLGVRNNGEIIGIQEDKIEKLKKQFVTTINNDSKVYPPLYLTPVSYESNGKQILYIRVPVSQDVVRCSGKIWDRNDDADIDITHHSDEVYRLYSRKHGSFFVNKVTHFGMDSLRSDLLERARTMTQMRMKNHPWKTMSDEEMLHSAGLILTDANLSHGHGALDPAAFEPFPKNPPISKVFREIGMADELGSGMRNTYKYTRMYSGTNPQFVEGDIFRITTPLTEVATAIAGPGGTIPHDVPHDVPHKDVFNLIYQLIKENPHITRKEIGERLGISIKTVGRKIKDMDDIQYVGSGNNGHWKIDKHV